MASQPGGAPLRLEQAASLDELRRPWQALAPRTGNVFATWEYADTWWRHFGAGAELLLFAARDPQDRIVAILPLYRERIRGIRVVRLIGRGIADELAPLCDASDRDVTAAALKLALAERVGHWQILLAENVRAADGWETGLGARVARRQSSPVLDIAGLDWDGLRAGFSANLRKQLRNRENRLLRRFALRYRMCADAEQLEADLETLFALHAARWNDGYTPAFTAERRAFHRDFAREALRNGWLRLWTAEVDGSPAASWYGFRFAGAESYYQSGRDPSLESLSVGSVLLGHTMREAAQDGQREYRFLRGDESYKGRYAARDAPVQTIVQGRGALPRALLAGAGMLAARPATRRMVPPAIRPPAKHGRTREA